MPIRVTFFWRIFLGSPLTPGLAQRPDEQVTDYGCRLETALDQTFKGCLFPQGNRADLLCERLWSGFRSKS